MRLAKMPLYRQNSKVRLADGTEHPLVILSYEGIRERQLIKVFEAIGNLDLPADTVVLLDPPREPHVCAILLEACRSAAMVILNEARDVGRDATNVNWVLGHVLRPFGGVKAGTRVSFERNASGMFLPSSVPQMH
jgi:hypothetical protein